MDLRFPEPLLQLAIIQIARNKLFPFDIGLYGYGVGDYGVIARGGYGVIVLRAYGA